MAQISLFIYSYFILFFYVILLPRGTSLIWWIRERLQDGTAPKAQRCLKPEPQPTMQHLYSALIQRTMSDQQPESQYPRLAELCNMNVDYFKNLSVNQSPLPSHM